MASTSILHIDMDAFFAAVEQLDNPALRGKNVVVGGAGPRGVVAAASYEVRRFGVRSAMPMFMAKQKCPDLVIVPPRRKRYAELSGRMMQILRGYSPLVEQVSIDEAYVDLTGCERLHGSVGEIARAIKTEIKTQLGLSCSVGAAPNKFLAKIASDVRKPDGLTIIEPRQIEGFIAALPINKVPGVGPKAGEMLTQLGIRRLGQVLDLPPELIVKKLGKFGHRLLELARGEDDSAVVPSSPAKSISSEITLERDTHDRKILAAQLLNQAQGVARQLRRHQLCARTITLKIKTADFALHTRSRTLESPIQDSETLFQTGVALLDSFGLKSPVRLIGLGAAGLASVDQPIQAALFPQPEDKRRIKWRRIDSAVDAIAARYGGSLVARGTTDSRSDENDGGDNE